MENIISISKPWRNFENNRKLEKRLNLCKCQRYTKHTEMFTLSLIGQTKGEKSPKAQAANHKFYHCAPTTIVLNLCYNYFYSAFPHLPSDWKSEHDNFFTLTVPVIFKTETYFVHNKIKLCLCKNSLGATEHPVSMKR